MCGIAGIWSKRRVDSGDATAMADRLLHRGPDDSGTWVDEDAGIALSHRRLSIIDLSSAGHQPMSSPCGRYIISFNGEIFNHREIRCELDADGALSWRGHSDTETLVRAIVRWGLAGSLERAVGQFAFGLWDRQTSTLSLVRDRAGEKPLYYGWCGNGIAFASELKALRAVPGFANAVDPAVLSLYLRYNQVPAPWSILRHVYKVEPGVIVTIDREALDAPPETAPSAACEDGVRGVQVRRYWSLASVVAAGSDPAMTEREAIDGVETRLTEAVRLQSIADVPVGAFLSGGVDSSLIVALMRTVSDDVRTFTIGFADSAFDEAPHARAVARHLGTEHSELYVDADAVRAVIPDLPHAYDEPFADSSQIPTMLLARMTRRSVTVALSGDGGDELFCGYNRYLVPRRFWEVAAALAGPIRNVAGQAITAIPTAMWDRLARLPLVPGRAMLGGAMLGSKVHKVGRILQTPVDVHDIYRASSEEWHDGLPLTHDVRLRSLTDDARGLEGTSAEERMMRWDMTGYLPDDILTKVDRATMACGVEARVPFLDHRVIEQAWRTPLAFKKRDGRGKWVLRQILSRHVPDALIDRPKAGFAIPIGAWLRGDLRDWAEDLLSTDALARQPAFDAAAIRRRWAQHVRGTHDWTPSLWGVLMYQAWAAERSGGIGDGSC